MDMQVVIAKMGPLGVPLLLCSIASLAVILERGAVLFATRLPRRRMVDDLIDATAHGDWEALAGYARRLGEPFNHGALVLIDNASRPRNLREDLATVWLDDLRARLGRNLKLLHLIAVISPLLGLLGTVIGMILAFQDIAAYNRPINPTVVADGLWQAMLTTAFGLSVALPALFFAHVYQMRVARVVAFMKSELNRLNLAIEMAPETAGEAGHDRR